MATIFNWNELQVGICFKLNINVPKTDIINMPINDCLYNKQNQESLVLITTLVMFKNFQMEQQNCEIVIFSNSFNCALPFFLCSIFVRASLPHYKFCAHVPQFQLFAKIQCYHNYIVTLLHWLLHSYIVLLHCYIGCYTVKLVFDVLYIGKLSLYLHDFRVNSSVK